VRTTHAQLREQLPRSLAVAHVWRSLINALIACIMGRVLLHLVLLVHRATTCLFSVLYVCIACM
jgi:hypothetical protein